MPKIAGSYYTVATAHLGAGATTQGELQRVNWFAIFLDDDKVLVRATDNKGLPSQVSRIVAVEEFFSKFIPDGEHYESVLLPLLLSAREKLDATDGDPSRLTVDEKVLYKALQLDANQVPDATPAQLKNMPRELLSKPQNYEAQTSEHKQWLNTASIESRKSGRYQEAIELYNAMLRTSPDDYHVMFNVARVYFEQQDYMTCAKCLQLALEYAPDFVEAKKFLAYLDKHYLGEMSEERFILRYRFIAPQECVLLLDSKKYAAEVIDISSSGLQVKMLGGSMSLLTPGKKFVISGSGLLKPLLQEAQAQVVWVKNDMCGAFLKSTLNTKSEAFKRIVGYARIV